MKKGSISGSSAQRPLTAKEEEKYGVSHHERLTSGVQFRHDKVTKLGQAKSNVQASKISAALTELQIPPRLVMPTARVCAEYERLILSIHTLLDVRKLNEKVEGEIKVCEAQKEEKERKERADIGELPQTPPTEEYDVPKKEVDEDEEEEEHRTKVEEADGASEDARVSAAPSARGGRHKRSASVMSGVSEKSTKRQRK
ncbi:MAG: swr complex subunit [Pleopsidium flavum]|nr:MAG: swr complex subunit [Pleopsidium flavum]